MKWIGKLVEFVPSIKRPLNYQAADDLEAYFGNQDYSYRWEDILNTVNRPCLVVDEYMNQHGTKYVKLFTKDSKLFDFPASCLKIVSKSSHVHVAE